MAYPVRRGEVMEKAIAEELCGLFEELALFAAETYRKAKALENMTQERAFTPEAFRLAEGHTDADGRLEALGASLAALRASLHLPPKDPPTLPEKPDAPDLSFLKD